MIFKKCLRVSKKVLSGESAGKVVTIVSSELPSIEDGLLLAPYIIIAPLSTIYAFTIIGINFKEAAVLGFIVYILIVISQGLLSKATVKWKYLEGLYSDKRIKVIYDAINGIRTIKSYGWEIPYKNQIQKWRRSQLSMLFRNHAVNSICAGFFMNGGLIISLVVFGYHFGMGREFVYSRSLTAFAMMNYLSQTSIYFSYSALSTFSTFLAIMFRVGEVLKMEEFDEEAAIDDESLPEGTRIKIENCNLSWGDEQKPEAEEHVVLSTHSESIERDTIHLRNINLEAQRGELVAIVGSTGSGKSSLLAAIMHELDIVSGTVKTNGTKAYVEQEPFIISGTVRENIVMGSIYNQWRFDKTVDV